MMDGIPILSQIKSFVQFVSGDSNGGMNTQKNFLNLCPLLSQGKSLVHAIQGNTEEAWNTQKIFLHGVNGMIDSVPIVGHVKGGFHVILGDVDGGIKALKASTRSVGVVSGGVGGFLAGGPVGAAFGGAAGGTCMDLITTAGDPNEVRYGIVEAINRIKDNPRDAGNYVDAVGGFFLDGLVGFTAGQTIVEKIQCKLEQRAMPNAMGSDATRHTGNGMLKKSSETKFIDQGLITVVIVGAGTACLTTTPEEAADSDVEDN